MGARQATRGLQGTLEDAGPAGLCKLRRVSMYKFSLSRFSAIKVAEALEAYLGALYEDVKDGWMAEDEISVRARVVRSVIRKLRSTFHQPGTRSIIVLDALEAALITDYGEWFEGGFDEFPQEFEVQRGKAEATVTYEGPQESSD